MSAALPSSLALLPATLRRPGVRLCGEGIEFALFAGDAERVELCLFDAEGAHELRRLSLLGPEQGVFHGLLPGAGPGLVYGYRVHGPWRPELGLRHDATRVLLDPYAREIVEPAAWRASRDTAVRSAAQAAALGLHARVAAPLPPLAAPRPRIAPEALVLYEVHVKGYSRLHPDIPEALRGTYSGLAHPAAIAHFKKLGVSAVSLLPVHYALDEEHLVARGMVNYWGYNTLGFLYPNPGLASRPDEPAAVVAEFRAMVEALHAAGIAVLLDVVYNHTAEGGDEGVALSFRGIDNRAWYLAESASPWRGANISGCGNTVNVSHPRVSEFVLDSLRYWVSEMGVDGFRFDLATVLGRDREGYRQDAAFFAALRADPLLAGVHLIAEPWDGGPQGYRLGQFPPPFAEWNDRFRDAARRFWLGQPQPAGEFAARMAGSLDLFGNGRGAAASVNFITAHDGFTLADLVSYSRKHNWANGEENRDGRGDELCANFGCEGPGDDPALNEKRLRLQSAMLATLLLARGTPMLCAGDELGRSQQGNNNAYCHDDASNWLAWPAGEHRLSRLVAAATALRRAHPALVDADVAWHGLADLAAEHDATAPLPGLRLERDGVPLLLLAFNPHPADRALRLAPETCEAVFCSVAAGVPAAASPIPAHALRVYIPCPVSPAPTF